MTARTIRSRAFAILWVPPIYCLAEALVAACIGLERGLPLWLFK